MLVDTIVIKLKRVGKGAGPDYDLTIYGHGNVIYEGKDNVKIKGKLKEPISEDKIMELLSEFRDSGFFSLKDEYMTTNVPIRPYTFISISMPRENGEMITRNITHYNDDKIVPNLLKNLEDKIDEIVGSDKWIGSPVDSKVLKPEPYPIKDIKPPSKEIKKPLPKPAKKKSVKLIAGIVAVVIAAALILSGIFTGVIPLFSSDTSPSNGGSGDVVNDNGTDDDMVDDTDDDTDEVYDLPKINKMLTASYLAIESDIYTEEDTFYKGDTVYIYYEFSNVTHNNSYDIVEETVVNFYTGEEYYSTRNEYVNDSTEYYEFKDYADIITDNSWPISTYTVTFTLEDKISKKTVSSSVDFTLIEYGSLIPSVTLAASPLTGTKPLDVDFTVNLDNFTEPLDYLWVFGDGETFSDEINTSHTYSDAGMYDAMFTITDSLGFSGSDSVVIIVSDDATMPLESFFTYENSTTYDYTFTAVATGGTPPYTYEWDFDYDAVTFSQKGTGETVSWTFASSDIYIVRLKVTDSIGNIDTYNRVISFF